MDSNGLLMRCAPLPLRSIVGFGFMMLVAPFTVHLPFEFSSIKFLAVTAEGPQFGKPGIECDLLYLACLATLVAGGSGPFSIDRWRASARDSIGALSH
jgi:putative oxidoreductase